MKRLFALVLMLTLLTACSAPAPEKELSVPEALTLSARVTVDYGERVYPFTLSLSYGASGTSLTILEPEIISGVTARLSEPGAELSFDGVQVYTGGLTPGGLSPMEALLNMPNQWLHGLVTEESTERIEGADHPARLTRVTDTVSLRTVFHPDTGCPVKAELISGGMTVIFCEFTPREG